MKLFSSMALAAFVAILSGCVTAPQLPVEIGATTFDAHAGSVGVAMTPLPKVDTYFPGASCLLCIAFASAANSALTSHVKALPLEDLPKLKDYVADALREKRGTIATVIAEALELQNLADARTQGPNVARKDFSSLREKYKVDKLVVIEIQALGVIRTYSAYFPTSDPKAQLTGRVYAVNLADNKYEWYLPVDITKSSDGNWDEPPSFPGLTNAYFQVIELGKDAFLRDLVK